MEDKGLSCNAREKTKKLKRKEVLEKKKAVDEAIRKAVAVPDHLASFPPFCRYDRKGISVHLESANGDRLSATAKIYVQNLLKVNMEKYFGQEWPTEEKVKRREMAVPEARYIFVRQSCTSKPEDGLDDCGLMDGQDRLVGFVHYRFVVEEDVPVAYVYELQLKSCAQGKGLGKFLMQLIELIARKNKMGAVMLTVQKSNEFAMNFYTDRLRYVISSTSPSRVDPLIGAEKNYEILCKTFDPEAKSKLEE